MRLFQQADSTHWAIPDMEGLAAIASATEPRRSARLFGAAAARRDEVGAFSEPVIPSQRDRAIDTIRTHLDERDFAEAWSEGRAMTLEQAIAYALDDGNDV